MGSESSAASILYGWVWFGALAYVVGITLWNAYKIRLGAIEEFGPVIHEFDPYFNYRATEVSRLLRSFGVMLGGNGDASWPAGRSNELLCYVLVRCLFHNSSMVVSVIFLVFLPA